MSKPLHFTFEFTTSSVFPKAKMSITETFHLAHKARGKLSTEASRSDHNLRLLVGHANLLDNLMIHLAEAEEQQERWFNNTVRGNEWMEMEEQEEDYGSLAADYSDTESDSSDESEEEEECEEEYIPFRPQDHPFLAHREAVHIGVSEVDEDYESDSGSDSDDSDGLYTLRRTTSRRPPSLCSDASDDEEEESNPPSPPTTLIHRPILSRKERQLQQVGPYYGAPPIATAALLEDHTFFQSSTMISSF